MLRCPECGVRRTSAGACPEHGPLVSSTCPTGEWEQVPALQGLALDRRLGVGAQGSVWTARRDRDGRDVCVKLTRPLGPAAIESWTREVACQTRAGPAIAPAVLGHGTTPQGLHWIEMTHVRGDTLAALLAKRTERWSCDEIATTLAPLIDSVAALHAAGIVHGDLKPENVIVALGRAVLLDFGSAHALDDVAFVPGPGTAEYLAPERCTTPPRSLPCSDVYALAVMAYELLAGAPPFFGPDELVLEAHRSRRPPSLVRRGLSAAIDDVLRAALAKDPRDRIATVAELAAALLPALRASAEARAVCGTSTGAGASAPRDRARVPLVWFRSAVAPSRTAALVARHDGALVHARGGFHVAAFSSGCLPSAIAAARALLDAGACARALVDIDDVVARRHGDGVRVFSPRFAFAARYPDEGDPCGLAFTASARELAPPMPLLPLSHRTDRFVPGEIEVPPPSPRLELLRGRDDLLDALAEAATRAQQGVPTLATVRGEPGSGRSRIAAAAGDRFAQHGAQVVLLRAPDAGAAALHGCVALLVRALLELPPDRPASPCSLLAKALRCSERDVPLGLLLALEWVDPEDPAVAVMRAAPGAIRTAIASTVADLLVRAAANRPLAVVIDDVDRADAALLDALEAATLAERRAPLSVTVLGRPDFARDRPDWSRRADRALGFDVLALDLPTTAELVRDGLQPALNVPDDVIEDIHRRTRGLPLLLVELIRTLRSGGALRRIADTTGWTFATDALQRQSDVPLAAWMAARDLDRLPAALGRHAAVVAAMGPDAEPASLENALRWLERGDHATPTDLDPWVAVSRLLAAGILRRDPHGVSFRHDALREHAAARLEPQARKQLHRAALDATAATTDPSTLAARLHHALGADASAEATRCALALADVASRRHAYVEAERCFGIACEHAPAGSDEALAAHHGRGLMRFRLGRHAQARIDLDRVAVTSESSRRAIDALLDAATVEDWCEDFVAAEALVERAEQLAVDASPATAARLTLARGRAAFRRGRIEEAIADLERAAERARELGDDAYETRVIALLLLAPLLGMTGEVARSLPLFDELFALCEAHADRIHLASALLNRPFVWMELGRHRELHEDLERVIALSRAAGFPLLESRARYNLGELAYLAGDTSAALEHVAHLHELERRLGEQSIGTRLLEARCRLYMRERGTARALVEELRARRDAGAVPPLMPSEEVLFRMVELASARADANAWATLIAQSEADSVQQELVEVLEVAGLAASVQGDVELARDRLERALAVAATIPTVMRPRIEQALAALPARTLAAG